ncbi:MAG: BlaI/MecI/CopY family transcriptional regulator [Bdellovibrionales bacterium]
METIKEIPKISDAEWKVMEVLWSTDKQLTSTDIIEALGESAEWSPKTIKTLIHRLMKKGALLATQSSNGYLYASNIDKSYYLSTEFKGFMHKFFEGASKPMFSYFVKSADLNPEDVKELKSLLDDIAKEEKSDV